MLCITVAYAKTMVLHLLQVELITATVLFTVQVRFTSDPGKCRYCIAPWR